MHKPPPPNLTAYKEDLTHPWESDKHIFIFTYTHRDYPFALYFTKSNRRVSHRGLERGCLVQGNILCIAEAVHNDELFL
jgi:hypothetical protein